MKTLLKLTGEFATQGTAADRDGRIIERNLADGSIPYVSGGLKRPTPRSPRAQTSRRTGSRCLTR